VSERPQPKRLPQSEIKTKKKGLLKVSLGLPLFDVKPSDAHSRLPLSVTEMRISFELTHPSQTVKLKTSNISEAADRTAKKATTHNVIVTAKDRVLWGDKRIEGSNVNNFIFCIYGSWS
jgi:hypothetical protein